jgi:small-conductance mechanosensitive channel
MREGSMRALWIVAALIGAAILIFTHATVGGIVVGIAFLGLAVFLRRRPLVHRIGLGHR